MLFSVMTTWHTTSAGLPVSCYEWLFIGVAPVLICAHLRRTVQQTSICSKLMLWGLRLMRYTARLTTNTFPTIVLLTFEETNAHYWPCLVFLWAYITCCVVSIYHEAVLLFVFITPCTCQASLIPLSVCSVSVMVVLCCLGTYCSDLPVEQCQ